MVNCNGNVNINVNDDDNVNEAGDILAQFISSREFEQLDVL